MKTHYCQAINLKAVDTRPTVCGWVLSSRDHGGIVFIDLRDSTGVLQLVFDPDTSPQQVKAAAMLKNESVIQITGVVRKRPEGTVNVDIQTGSVELMVEKLTILNAAQSLPFALDDAVSEEVRLTYRYLDIRRKKMRDNLKLRSDVFYQINQFLHQHRFQFVETPVLTKSTPEGARDFLVPTRGYHGSAFALPQSPQLFKQLLMVSGIDRYYQIVKCFRDEDLRADRQPEFTQLDLEMAFVTEQDVMDIGEQLVRQLFKKQLNIELPEFQIMTYFQSMEKFGTDAPDLRNPLEFFDIKPLMKSVEFKVFSQPANDPCSKVVVMLVPGGAAMTRKTIDDYTNLVGQYGAKGLAYIRINAIEKGTEGLQSPILKFLDEKTIDAILDKTKAKTGDLLFFGAGKKNIVNDSFCALRNQLGRDLHLLKTDWAPVWIIDFPMFDEREQKLTANHHPFTLPKDDKAGLESPKNCLSHAYDLVLNGHEVGGGSLRIHDAQLQTQVLGLCGLSDEQIKQQFGFFIRALSLGAPPHGGMAIGLDRLLMLMGNTHNIRDVIAFPKTQSGRCLLTEAPSVISEEQLKELSIRLLKKQPPSSK